MTARMVATFVLAVPGASDSFDSGGSSVMRVEGSVVVGRESLKAWVAVLTSMRVEKAASRSLVRTWVNGGESMRSEVSSRRRRGGGSGGWWWGGGHAGLLQDEFFLFACWEEVGEPFACSAVRK